MMLTEGDSFKIVRKHINLRMWKEGTCTHRERKGQREGVLARRLISSLQIHIQIGDERKRER